MHLLDIFFWGTSFANPRGARCLWMALGKHKPRPESRLVEGFVCGFSGGKQANKHWGRVGPVVGLIVARYSFPVLFILSFAFLDCFFCCLYTKIAFLEVKCMFFSFEN